MLFPIQSLLDTKDNPEILTIQRSTKVRVAVKKMQENDYDQLPVVDEEGRLVGLLSEHDIVQFTFHFPAKTSVFDIECNHCMSKPVTMRADEDVTELFDALRTSASVIIVDNAKPIGILTDYDTTHFLRDYAEGLLHINDIELTLRPD